jgi:MscS family membrane protein
VAPDVLALRGPLGLTYGQWLFLAIFALVAWPIGRAAAFVTLRLARAFLVSRPWIDRLFLRLARPIALAWAVTAFDAGAKALALSPRVDAALDRALRIGLALALFWGLLRAVTVAGEEIAAGEWARSRPSARSLSSIGMSLARIFVAALASMFALSELGYAVTSIIAGLGIGGIALALAAQKTVENLFGSISILADQPFRVGDTVRVDGIEGIVESIGLRSTRFRTPDRTTIVFPNGKLADMRIESLGARERMRFTTKLLLSRQSTVKSVAAAIDELRTRLTKHPSVYADDVGVRLAAIGEYSFDVEVSAQITTLDPNEFARVREELLVLALDVVDRAGAKLAIPSRQLFEAKLT